MRSHRYDRRLVVGRPASIETPLGIERLAGRRKRGSVKAELVVRQADLDGVSGVDGAVQEQYGQPVSQLPLQDPP